MELNQDTNNKNSFFNHIFSLNEEEKGEMLNVAQYGALGLIPVLILNKLIQRFIPEADPDKSSVELAIEILIQLIIILFGIMFIHKVITYVPTYSGFKYEQLCLTHIVLAFLIIVLSIQSKMGLKMNILFDRADVLWNGPNEGYENPNKKPKKHTMYHNGSQADDLDNSAVQRDLFPPAPVATNRPQTDIHQMQNEVDMQMAMGPMAANSVLGGSFGSSF